MELAGRPAFLCRDLVVDWAIDHQAKQAMLKALNLSVVSFSGLNKLVAVLSACSLSMIAIPAASRADQPSPAQLKLLQLNLRDAVKPTWGFQSQLQGAGTPNAIGIGAFLPITYGSNSITFLDVLDNYNLADRNNNSSLDAAEVFGGTISPAPASATAG